MALRKLFFALAAPLVLAQAAAAHESGWTAWSADAFARAKAEKRLLILDLEAVWCHWCHVMARKTYGDGRVAALIAEKFVAMRADQDASPELASRYGDWGWPATIIFAPDGTELAKFRGYVEPERMAAILQTFIDDPTPGPSAFSVPAVTPASDARIPADLRAEQESAFAENFDSVHAGWGVGHKYIDGDSLDYAIARAESGDAKAESQARKTLAAARALIDPVWGGVYQYSDADDWSSPHFEKLATFQAQYLRQYAQAYARWRDPADLKAAEAIKAYLLNFLHDPQGGFYVSQDADLDEKTDGHTYYALGDSGRRKLGLPRIDTSIYARENGMAISALTGLYAATGDETALEAARAAAQWVKARLAVEAGGFQHGEKGAGVFLSDNLAMSQAFVDLYAATGGRLWLKDALAAGRFIAAHFRQESGGFFPARTSEAPVGALAKPLVQIDDQIAVARLMTLLNRYSGEKFFADQAEHALRYAVAAAQDMARPLPGLLLAEREMLHAPTHITILGPKGDVDAQKLAAAARAFPAANKRLDWWDRAEGPLDNPDISYPEMDQPAAFACGDRICSLPVFTPEDLKTAVERMARLAREPKGTATR